jgi:hypothetical protein
MGTCEAAAVGSEVIPQRGCGSFAHGMGADANHAWLLASTPQLVWLEEEVHALPGPIQAFAAILEQARATEPLSQIVQQVVEPV